MMNNDLKLVNKEMKQAVFFCILLLCPLWLCAAGSGTDDTEEELLLQGRRYFMGLLPVNNEQKACTDCHYTFSSTSDTILWGPSVMELHMQAQTLPVTNFINKLKSPIGKRAQEVHGAYELSDEELTLVYNYLQQYTQPKAKPVLNRLLLFLFLGLLITWALFELLIRRKMKWAIVPLAFLTIGLLLQLGMVHVEAIRIGRNKGYGPDQPIRFSHKIHAGENQMDCKYCHNYAVHNKSSGIPSVSTCMNCHVLIRQGSHSGGFEIAKVVNGYEQKKAIRWTRIHNLPDHVYYNHAQHVNVAGLDCSECHGNVAEMGIMKQHSDLSMGWCVNCHRETEVKGFHTSNYYKSLFELQEDFEAKGTTPTADDIGANDCMRCHY